MSGVYSLVADQILTATYTTPPMQPGTVVAAQNGNKYRLVYNYSETTSVSQYSACYLYSASYNSWAVAARTTDALATRLAVGVAATLIGTQHYGWVCIDGICTGYMTAACATTGFPLAPSGTGGLTPSTGASTANNFAAQGNVFARAIGVVTAAGTALVEVYNGI